MKKVGADREKLWKLFTKLIRHTTPYGCESELYELLPDRDAEVDEYGNVVFKIGKKTDDTLFCSHLDNSCLIQKRTKWFYENGIIRTDRRTILGADDKAGVLLMCHMIENNVNGTYVFHIGEEHGGVGSTAIQNDQSGISVKGFKRAIAFDRKGTTSIITHQMMDRCCSEQFAEALGEQLGMRADNGGTFTDTANYMEIVPECTNVSVGYFQEHMSSEIFNFNWFVNILAEAVLKVDWEALPTVRDPKDRANYTEYMHRFGGFGRFSGLNWDSRGRSQRMISSFEDDDDDDIVRYQNYLRKNLITSNAANRANAEKAAEPEQHIDAILDSKCAEMCDKCKKLIRAGEKMCIVGENVICQECAGIKVAPSKIHSASEIFASD